MRGAILAAIVACSALLPTYPALSQEFTYNLVLVVRYDDGVVTESPFPKADFWACKQEKARQKIGRRIPAGLSIRPGGKKSPAGVVIGVKCVQRTLPRLGM